MQHQQIELNSNEENKEDIKLLDLVWKGVKPSDKVEGQIVIPYNFSESEDKSDENYLPFK